MSSHTMHGNQVEIRKGHGPIGENNLYIFWSFGVRLRRCEKMCLHKYGQLSKRDSWERGRVCKWVCLIVLVFERDKINRLSATWVGELRLALELREQRNEDADGHTLHLGPWPKVNNVQGAIWLRLEAGGELSGGQKRAVRGSRGWREGLRRAQAYGKADFSSPCSSQRRQMSAWAASTLDCAALGTTTWPSLLSHRVWAAVTLWSLSPGQRKALRCSSSPTCTHVHQHLLHVLLFFTQEKYKETCLLWLGISLKVLARRKKKSTLYWNLKNKLRCLAYSILSSWSKESPEENPSSWNKTYSKLFKMNICELSHI